MKLRIGTRGSKLALAQTGLFADALRRFGAEIDLVEIKTIGDRKQGTTAAGFGDKKDWIYELELALLASSIDLAVHSGKDVPGNTEPGTALLPVLGRESPYDVFIGKKESASGRRIEFAQLSTGAIIGTSSLRRKAQLLRARPDLKVVDHRGNVPTRLEKLDNSTELSGIVLAEAGLSRLGLHALNWERLPEEVMLPALNQGTLMVQYREGDLELVPLLRQTLDRDTEISWSAERACVALLNADCNSAVGVFAQVLKSEVIVRGRVLLPNGQSWIESLVKGSSDKAAQLGREVGQELLNQGAAEIIAQSRRGHGS